MDMSLIKCRKPAQAECRLISTTFSIYKGKSKGKPKSGLCTLNFSRSKVEHNKEKSGQDKFPNRI
jgi:hypothetical protein